MERCKCIKYLIVILVVSLTQYSSNSQITISAYQDLRLAVSGDDHGNDFGTLDLVLRSEWQARQTKLGYVFVYPQWEYADLAGGSYNRYAGGAGFTFNTWAEKIDFSPSVNWGMLGRFERTFFTWEFVGDLSFRISDRFRFSTMGSFTQRTDLDYSQYLNEAPFKKGSTWIFNFYFGLKYYLIKRH